MTYDGEKPVDLADRFLKRGYSLRYIPSHEELSENTCPQTEFVCRSPYQDAKLDEDKLRESYNQMLQKNR